MNMVFVKNLIKRIASKDASLHAGNLTYLLLLAIIPSLIIATSILSFLNRYFPLLDYPLSNILSLFLSKITLNKTSSILINIICVNLLSSGIYSLISSIETIYHFKFKNYIRKKLYSIALSVITITLIILGFSLSFTILRFLPFQKIDIVISALVTFASLLVFYKFSTFQKVKNLYPGALLSGLFLSIFHKFFTYIARNFSKLQLYYGTLTPIIISLLLVYYSCYIIYCGIIFNHELAKIYGIKHGKALKIITGKITNAYNSKWLLFNSR